MPNIPTLPFDQACFDSQSITTSPSLLDLGVLIRDQRALAVASAADVDGCDHVAALHEVRIERPVAAARLVLAIGQVLEQYREFLAGLSAGRAVEIGREANAIGEGDPVAPDLHAVGCGLFRRSERGEWREPYKKSGEAKNRTEG